MVRTPSLPDTFLPPETLVRRVDELMHWADFGVDGVPPSWDLELTVVKSGVEKIDHEAQRVLAFLLTWHSSRHGRPRFSGPAVNLSYALLRTRFRIAKDDGVRGVLNRLEHDHGVIHRFSRGLGEGKGSVLYLAPNVDRVEDITYPVVMDPRTGELRRWRAGDPVSGGPYSITSIPRHEADAAGISCSEDDDAVHIVSFQRRITQGCAAPDLPVDATDVVGARPSSPAYADAFSAEYVAAYAGQIDHAGIDGGSRMPETGGGRGLTGPVGPLCPLEQVGATGPVTPGIPDAFGPASQPTTPTELHALTPGETPVRHAETARASGAEEATVLPLGVRGQAPTNAWAHGTVDNDLRLGHMLGLFRWLYARELERATTVKARRSVVRAAWEAATQLLPGEISSDAVYNAWQRLERAGSADPALDLLGVAVLACGRCTGTVDERVHVARSLLDAVSRGGVTDAVDSEQPQDVAAVDRALRAALQHRLDRFGLARVVVHVCGLARAPKTYAFVNGLVRHYETHEVPFNAALFAGALASVVRDHRDPTTFDLLGACESEVRLHLLSRVRAGDQVRLGAWALSTERLVPHESVVTLATPPARGEDEDVWDTVEEVCVERSGFVVITTGRSVVSLDRAEVEQKDDGWLYALAHRTQRVAR